MPDTMYDTRRKERKQTLSEQMGKTGGAFQQTYGQKRPDAWGSWDRDRRQQWKQNHMGASGAQTAFNQAYGGQTAQGALDARAAGTLKPPPLQQGPGVGTDPQAAGTLAAQMNAAMPGVFNGNPETGVASEGPAKAATATVGAKDGGWSWKDSPFNKNKQKGRVDPTGNYGEGKTLAGAFDPALLGSIEDEGTRDLLIQWNKQFQQFQDSQGLGGLSTKQHDKMIQKLQSLRDGLEAVGFDVTALDPTGGGGGGDGGETGTGDWNVGGVPDPTRGEVDLGGGLPNLFQSMPAAIRNMFNLGKNPSPEKIAAATSAYMDMWRENKGLMQQQLGVNEMDRALGDIRDNPLRTMAESEALSLAEMGDPTNWETVKNQMASDYAKSTQNALGGLGASAARRGMSPGSQAGLAAQVQSQQGDSLARALADLENVQAKQGYDYKARGIDALTNTFGATQTPLTNAQMMLSQALMGEAPYSGNFGSGTNLYDSATGNEAIALARQAADSAGDVDGLTQALGFGQGLTGMIGGLGGMDFLKGLGLFGE